VLIEQRIRSADARWRTGKGWNDCGRTYLVLGAPDFSKGVALEQHFAAPDALRQMVDQEGRVSDIWLYRSPKGLPAAADGYRFGFDPACQFVTAPTVERLLNQAARTFLQPEK